MKLAELMVAVGIFVLGGGVAYPLFVGDLNLYARNFSINKSDNSLRYALQKLKRDINMAIEPPNLVNYSTSGANGVLTLAAQGGSTSTPVWGTAQGILLWVNLGPAYDMPGSGTITTSGSITLTRRVSSTNDDGPNSPVPQVGDRLVIMSPAPYATGMPETVAVTAGSSTTISKPGRQIASVTASAGSTSISVTLVNGGTLPTITGNQSVYIIREVAYVVTPYSSTASKLLYFPTTYNMAVASAKSLILDLDATPYEIDSVTGAIIQPFNYYTGKGTLTPLSINLPVRAVDYANAVAGRYVAAGTTNISSEFNVYLRSNPQMGVKVRLD